MDSKERRYFERMAKYSPRNITTSSMNNAAYLAYCKPMINKTAKDALSEEISQNNAKKEISDLLETINKLKKGVN